MPAISLIGRSFDISQATANPVATSSKRSASIFNLAPPERVGRVVRSLVSREIHDDSSDDGSDHVITILLIILGIAFLALMTVSIVVIVRRSRMRTRVECEQPILPTYSEAKHDLPNHRALKIETTHNGRSSVVVISSRDAQPMLRSPNAPPHSPDNVPEIHITFPDEHDDQGRRKSGRVVVVRVGENATVGLEPMQEEQLPAYEKEANDQFYSIDFDDIGGLREKDHSIYDEKC
ncbi:hypothetical protein ESCO_000201 [Escovopsis weberi]|uniref:Uncharacterized protein n=1 Tax=Escovopsis weberi TaxID=150374 RepID=A0A0M8N306_ESCWE|nr:hypothetical protein ESCO_000201 [Escovopsis weberi]